jgi:hypothetical protein
MHEFETKPTLGPIRAVTYSVPDLRAIEAAYVAELGYVSVASGRVDQETAQAWGTPVVEGRRMLVLGPASGECVFLRFIESPDASGWRALTTFGWNATEFVVQDVEGLARRLEGGAFEIIGAPKGLTRFPMIRAMQAIGPAGECCYFTEVGPGSGMNLAAALSYVGRVFIVVCAGPDANALFAPYSHFANSIDPPVATPVRVISDAHGLPPETLHRHGLVRLSDGTLVELDAYPPSARPRDVRDGDLPPGMAIVSFDIDRLDASSLVSRRAQFGIRGSRSYAACVRGAVGELIELVARSG